MVLLDATCMLLIAIGESLKNLDKTTNGQLLPTYPSIPWKNVKGLRDIIAHHYFDVDAAQILWIIQNEINQKEEGDDRKGNLSMGAKGSGTFAPFSFFFVEYALFPKKLADIKIYTYICRKIVINANATENIRTEVLLLFG